MVFISQAVDEPLAVSSHNYFFDNTAGAGITVYVADSGAVIDSTEFTDGANVAANAEWLYIDPVPGSPPYSATPGDGGYHGTCMLSKVCGRLYGAAKRINPVIVKGIPAADHITASPLENAISQLAVITDHVFDNGGENTVLSWSR